MLKAGTTLNPVSLPECDPTHKVISKVKEMIQAGELKAGSKLPAERKLAEELNVGRTHVRNAFQKLEFYGIVRTYPQSGSVISSIRLNAIDGLISDVLSIDEYDFFSLVETRLILEVEAIRLASERWTRDDMIALEKAHADYLMSFDTENRVEKDMNFHRVIAQTSHNEVIKSMLLVITPDILNNYFNTKFCLSATSADISDHQVLIDAIRERNPAKAVSAMRLHLDRLYTFAKSNYRAH